MRKMTDKQEKICDDLMDLYEFEVYENNEGKLQVNDLQGACLGDICSEVFDDKFDIIERMNIYHIDYIITPLEWEFDKSFDTMVEWLDFLVGRSNTVEEQEDDWNHTIEILKLITLCDERKVTNNEK